MIEVLEIEQRCKPNPLATAAPEDFAVRPGGSAEPDLVLQTAHLTPYCLDDMHRRVLFVETPAEVDIAAHPFLYQAQYEQARRLLVVPYATLIALAEALPAPRVPLVLIHSQGRSGSTLLSKAFQQVGVVSSLSEPDIYTQAVAIRAQDRTRDAELTGLMAATTRLLFKPACAGDAVLWVLKFRSFCIEVADLLDGGFGQVRNIFLYRDLRPWMVSTARAFGGGDLDVAEAVRALRPYVPLLGPFADERGSEGMTGPELATLMWLSTMQRFVELARQGQSLHTVRYEQMAAHPAETLGALFRYIGIDEALVGAAQAAFERDAQEGTLLSRAAVSERGYTGLSEDDWAQVDALVRRFPLPAEAPGGLPLAACAAL